MTLDEQLQSQLNGSEQMTDLFDALRKRMAA